MHRRLRILLRLLAVLCIVGSAQAQIVLPAGSSMSLNGGRVLLAGVDADLAGQLSLGSGELLDAGHLTLQATGTLDLGTGRLQLAGDWSNASNFVAAQGLVEFIDGRLPASASIFGDNDFFDLSIVSNLGKRYRLETASTQFIGGLLTLRGVGPALQIDTTAGPVAFLQLAPAPSGAQAINNVGVSDVHATGQHLAPTQTNQGGSGNDAGWFGQVAAALHTIPAGSWFSGALLILVLSIVGSFALVRRQP